MFCQLGCILNGFVLAALQHRSVAASRCMFVVPTRPFAGLERNSSCAGSRHGACHSKLHRRKYYGSQAADLQCAGRLGTCWAPHRPAPCRSCWPRSCQSCSQLGDLSVLPALNRSMYRHIQECNHDDCHMLREGLRHLATLCRHGCCLHSLMHRNAMQNCVSCTAARKAAPFAAFNALQSRSLHQAAALTLLVASQSDTTVPN